MPVAALLGLLAAAVMLLSPALASADTSSSLTVVGTSDVSDSGLVPNLIGPAFHKAYPQYTFKYIGTATGTAIADAESGSVGASALIVHAASLENQFVAKGYSSEQYGRALFTNDFVLAGPTSDPAGAAANGAHNVAQAFADIAAAGMAGKATFVSRGGTPGTTVEEHKIWELMSDANLAPSGLLLCTVGAADGGGETPITAGNGVTASGQPCPNGGALPTAAALPSWYVATGLTQGPNVIAANACTAHASGANSCYVLTDRGTYDYLASGTDPAGKIPGLQIVTRDDSTTAPGGQFGLINYFHGYIISPKKVAGVNVTAAQDFLNLVTSPTMQTQIAGYLAHTSDPGGAPFKPDASPLITESGIPSKFHAGKAATVRGTVTNAEPGYPALSRVPVTIDEVAARALVPVAHGITNFAGAYKIKFVAPVTGTYEVTTGQIAKIEIPSPTLSPPFGDLLSPASSTPTRVTVYSAITRLRVSSIGNRALVLGTDAPGFGHVKAKVTVGARKAGSKGRYRTVAHTAVGPASNNFALDVRLLPGKWQLRIVYSDPKAVKASKPRTVTVTVSKPQGFVDLSSVHQSRARLTIGATVLPKRLAPGATVKLLVMKSTGGAPLRFRQLTSAKVPSGTNTVTLHGTLKGTGHFYYELQLLRPGAPPSYSPLRQALLLPRKK